MFNVLYAVAQANILRGRHSPFVRVFGSPKHQVILTIPGHFWNKLFNLC